MTEKGDALAEAIVNQEEPTGNEDKGVRQRWPKEEIPRGTHREPREIHRERRQEGLATVTEREDSKRNPQETEARGSSNGDQR